MITHLVTRRLGIKCQKNVAVAVRKLVGIGIPSLSARSADTGIALDVVMLELLVMVNVQDAVANAKKIPTSKQLHY